MPLMLEPLGAGHLPVVLAILMAAALGVTYVLAVFKQDVDPWFPYISDDSAKSPESCVFGLFVNIAAFLGLLNVYIRYRLVKELNRGSDRRLKHGNIMALVLGVLAAFGLAVVANFQETAVPLVHGIGAMMCFIGAVLYGIFHTVLSYRMYPLYNGIRICRIRAVIAFVAVAALVTTSVCTSLGNKKFEDAHPDVPIPMPWTRSKSNLPGYNLHVAGAIAEWVLAVSFATFLLSYSREFEKLKVGVTVEPLVLHLDDSPIVENPRQSVTSDLLVNT